MDILTKKNLSSIYTVSLLALVFLTGTFALHADTNNAHKQKVIAGAIYKFIKFVDWNDETLKIDNSFNLCLLQYDKAFEPFKKRTHQGKSIQVLVFENTHHQSCHALYLNSDDNHDKVLQHFKKQAVLTISEQLGFVEKGGMIELGNHNNRLVFSINQAVAKANQLNIAFQLLSLARKVIES